MSQHVVDVLQSRGLLDAVTSDALYERAKKPLKVYCGFDPSSDSLHLGNLLAIIGLAHFQRCGHTPVVLIGGATGMIGDPSGKAHERNLLDEQTLRFNEKGIQKDIEKILKPSSGYPAPIFVNNYDWFKNFSFLHFLRDVGKQFRIGPMLSKDSVRTRFDTEEGMSFTEFSYQLLQGYDFYHLFSEHDVSVQIGGSDQWGNITAGIEYTRKVTSEQVFGLTWPLLLKNDGQKFGKSEKGAVWLSGDKLSPYEFYQFLYRTQDADVIAFLRRLTFIDLQTIRELELNMQDTNYTPNRAQKLLAETLTEMVHGAMGLEKALLATQSVMPGKVSTVNSALIEELLTEVPHAELEKQNVVDQKLIDVVVQANFVASKGDMRRLIRNGGVWLNNQKVDDENFKIQDADLIDKKFLLVALGKKNKFVISTCEH